MGGICVSEEEEKKKNKKQRKQRRTGASNESGSDRQQKQKQMVSSSFTNSSLLIKKKNSKKKKSLDECGHSIEASSEKEKQSLLAWVEMCMKQKCSDGSKQGFRERDVTENLLSGKIFLNEHSHGRSAFSGNGRRASEAHYGNGTCNQHAHGERHFHHDGDARDKEELSSSQHECLSNGFSSNFQCPGNVLCRLIDSKSFSTGIEKCLLKAHGVRLVEGASVSNAQALKARTDCCLLENHSQPISSSTNTLNKKRKREDDKVLQYILKRSILVSSAKRSRTTKTVVTVWGRQIPVTVTSEASTIQEWISSQTGDLFGLDVEWRPNRAKNQKNKVALMQLCSENDCLIIQMLFLDRKPPALCKLLADPLKGLAGVGIFADTKRLWCDYGLECQGGIELTTLAVERLKREELRNVGLKVLVQEVLGVRMEKSKRVTMSNWAKVNLDWAQINYACIDAWASFALSHKLLAEM